MPARDLTAVQPLRPFVHTLREIAAEIGGEHRGADAIVSGITLHGAHTVAGDLFVALPGASTHGARFAPEALSLGAVAVLTDTQGAAEIPQGVPVIVVEHVRRVLGPLSAWFFDHPADDLTTIGVTGTQGKTTTTHLIAAALSDRHAGVIGSMGSRIDGRQVPSSLTTPEAPALHRMLAVMRANDVEVVAAEVSSQGIVQQRTAGLLFDIGVMLNLGHDHRDFHGDQESYYAAKRELLTRQGSRRALTSIDFTAGRRLARDPELDAVTFSIARESADWFATDIRDSAHGTAFVIRTPDGHRVPFETPLRGEFHVTDILAAVASLAMTGRAVEDLREGLASFTGVEGRMQFLDVHPHLTVVIDAGHKPEAINALLVSLRSLTAGRIICVIGSNGNRDAHKRPLMGRFAGTASDIVVVTDDNPAHEDPASIRDAVTRGARSTAAEVHDVAGRTEAIRLAVSLARAGDTLVVVGKGDERHQILAEGIVPHSDPDEIERALVDFPLRCAV